MSFDGDLGAMGFELVQSSRDGARRYVRKDNPFMQWWVHVFTDETVELTWEFELGSYLLAKGFAVSVQDELSLLLFPAGEVRGPAEGSWVSGQIDQATRLLESVSLPGAT